jgi:hypothetical protein
LYNEGLGGFWRVLEGLGGFLKGFGGFWRVLEGFRVLRVLGFGVVFIIFYFFEPFLHPF